MNAEKTFDTMQKDETALGNHKLWSSHNNISLSSEKYVATNRVRKRAVLLAMVKVSF